MTPEVKCLSRGTSMGGLLPLEIKSCVCAGKEMCYAQLRVCHEKPWLLLFERVCSVWLLSCSGGSTVNLLREDEWCIVVFARRRLWCRLRFGRESIVRWCVVGWLVVVVGIGRSWVVLIV